MLPLNPNIQHLLMKIPLPPRPPQPPNLVIHQLPPHKPLQLLPANLLHRLALLGGFDARLEARLHADAHGCFEGECCCIAADVDRAVFVTRGVVFVDAEEGLCVAAVGL